MNYSNIFWKEKLLNYSTSIALGKKILVMKKIKIIINYIDYEIESIYFILIIALFCSFLKILIETNNDFVNIILQNFSNKPHITFIFSYIVSFYISELLPLVPTYILTNYIIFSIIIFYKLNQ